MVFVATKFYNEKSSRYFALYFALKIQFKNRLKLHMFVFKLLNIFFSETQKGKINHSTVHSEVKLSVVDPSVKRTGITS